MRPVTAPTLPVGDELLIARAARGDESALQALFHGHRDAAYRVAYRLLGNADDALDAVQDGFIKALRRLNGFEYRSSFRTWLLRVVSNAALDLGRQRRRREELNAAATERAALDGGMTPDHLDPCREAEESDLRRLLHEALAQPARIPTANLRLARRWRAELSRGGRHDGNFDRHGYEPAVLCPTETESDACHASPSMNDPRSDKLPPSWLAAYADGELTARERARVENWLAANPEGHDLLEEQESLGPGGRDFWQIVDPPMPTLAQWRRVEHAITTANPIQPRRSWPRWLGTVGLLATAASLVLFLSLPNRPAPSKPAPKSVVPSSPIAREAPYAMASDDEVEIISLPESAAGYLVVGEHPLHGSSLALADFGEVEFYGVGSDLAGRFPEMPTKTNTEDVPMIWAPRAP